MLVAPASRCRLMARFRRVAMTCGPLPVRICERSSAKVTSRTQCRRTSMDQWPRAPAKSGLDFLTCGDAAQHAGDGRLLGRHGPGDDHEGSSRHLLITT